jgi:hypothetical protein
VMRPLDENLWAYALDDPTTYLDPLGLYAVHDDCGRSCRDEDVSRFSDWQARPLAHYRQPVHRRPMINPRSGMVMGYVSDTGWTWSDLGRGAWSIIRGTPGAANDLLTGLTSEGIRRTVAGLGELGGMAWRSVDITHMKTLRRQWAANAVTAFLLTPIGLPIASQLYAQQVSDQIRHSQHPWTEVGVQFFNLGMLFLPFAGEAKGASLVADVGGLSSRVTAVVDISRAPEALLQHAMSDPLRALGSAAETHPAELEASIGQVEGAGGQFDLRPGSMGYSPSLSPGEPGRLILDPEASVGALRHEMAHFAFDQAAGYPGLGAYISNPRLMWESEAAAYKTEIDYAIGAGQSDAASQLLEFMHARWVELGAPGA